MMVDLHCINKNHVRKPEEQHDSLLLLMDFDAFDQMKKDLRQQAFEMEVDGILALL